MVKIFISEYFSFDGRSSQEFGLMLVKTNDGLISGQFGVNRSLVKEYIPKANKFYTYGVAEEPLKFTIQIAKTDEWTDNFILDVVNWLFVDDYKAFYSYDNPSIVYWCMPVGNPERFFNGLKQGYAELEFECDSSHAWSPIQISNFDLINNETTTVIELENKTNIYKYYYPKLEFTLQGSTSLTLKNLTDGGREFIFTELTDGETISVDNEKKIIISSMPSVYRYSNFNKNWFRLTQGMNYIEVIGKCTLDFKCEFPIGV